MKVIISMSGMSSRFTNAGYNVPKFMIDVDGKKVIEHIVDPVSYTHLTLPTIYSV